MNHMIMGRRRFLGALGAAGLVSALPAIGEDFPSRPISAISPFSPGGMTEQFFRPLWQLASPQLRQKIVVEYRPGATGAVALNYVANAKPDGYTLLHYYSSMLLLPYLEPVSYNMLRDFTYIIALADVPYGVAVAANSPYKTLGELFAAAKQRPGALNYAIAGLGTGGHVLMEKLMQDEGVKLRDIPYKGVEYIPALMGGQVDAAVGSPSWGPQVRAGQLRVLAYFSQERLKSYPDVPTTKELGFSSANPFPMGIIGPKGMPASIVRTLHDALKTAIDDPKMEKIMEHAGTPKLYMNSGNFTEWVAKAFVENGKIMKRIGIATQNPAQ